MSKRQKIKRVGWQFIKFGIVGASSTVINTGLYMLMVAWLWPTIAYGLSYAISTYNGYYWQTKYVFPGEHGFKQFVKVFLAYLPGLVIGVLLVKWLTKGFHYPFLGINIDGLGVPKIWAQVPTLFVTVPINFLLQKMWAYRRKPIKDEAGELA
ncbi:GtrA family protein [Treponema sp. R6D11]